MTEEIGERVARARAVLSEEARGAVEDTRRKIADTQADALDILLTQPADAAVLIVPALIVGGAVGFFVGSL